MKMRKIIVSNSLPEKTTEEVIDNINEAIEIPVRGCPTIHHPNEKVWEDYDNRDGQMTLPDISALSELQDMADSISGIRFDNIGAGSLISYGPDGAPGQQFIINEYSLASIVRPEGTVHFQIPPSTIVHGITPDVEEERQCEITFYISPMDDFRESYQNICNRIRDRQHPERLNPMEREEPEIEYISDIDSLNSIIEQSLEFNWGIGFNYLDLTVVTGYSDRDQDGYSYPIEKHYEVDFEVVNRWHNENIENQET